MAQSNNLSELFITNAKDSVLSCYNFLLIRDTSTAHSTKLFIQRQRTFTHVHAVQRNRKSLESSPTCKARKRKSNVNYVRMRCNSTEPIENSWIIITTRYGGQTQIGRYTINKKRRWRERTSRPVWRLEHKNTVTDSFPMELRTGLCPKALMHREGL